MTFKYTPIAPFGHEEPKKYAFDELEDLSRALNEAQEFAFVQELHAEPIRLRAGMIALADGTDWNPGSGAGFYGYDGGWKPLSSGLAFPATQVASSDANTLDDYEEGEFTPGVAFGGGTTGITYTTRSGRYVKVGRFANARGYVELSSKGSSTGAATVTGLPFTVLNTSVARGHGQVSYFNNFNGITAQIFLMADPNTTTAAWFTSSTTFSGQFDHTSFNNNSLFYFDLNYEATA